MKNKSQKSIHYFLNYFHVGNVPSAGSASMTVPGPFQNCIIYYLCQVLLSFMKKKEILFILLNEYFCRNWWR